MIKQGIPSTSKVEISNELWALNPNTAKLQPNKIGPYVVVKANYNTNMYTLQSLKRKQRKLPLDSLGLCQFFETQCSSSHPASCKLLLKYIACNTDRIPKDY